MCWLSLPKVFRNISTMLSGTASVTPQAIPPPDLFDGFDTITEKEIAAGNIAADLGNYMKIDNGNHCG